MAAPSGSMDFEQNLAQKLACNDRTVRDRAVKKLRKYLEARSQSQKNGFTHEDMIKVWKGLHYCMWMADKPIFQEDLAELIASLIHNLKTTDSAFMFLDTFFETECREWYGIDRLRIDKFMLLIRQMFRQTLVLLKNKKWNKKLVKQFLDFMTRDLISASSVAPIGVKTHVQDIYYTELTKVGTDELTSDQVLTFFEPFIQLYAKTNNKNQVHRIFNEIIVDSDVGISEARAELRAEEPPRLNIDYTKFADRMFEVASSDKCKKANRNQMYHIVKKFRNLAEGIFPRDRIPSDSEDSLHGDDINQAVARLQALDNQAKKKKRKRKQKSLENDESDDDIALEDDDAFDDDNNDDGDEDIPPPKKRKKGKKKSGDLPKDSNNNSQDGTKTKVIKDKDKSGSKKHGMGGSEFGLSEKHQKTAEESLMLKNNSETGKMDGNGGQSGKKKLGKKGVKSLKEVEKKSAGGSEMLGTAGDVKSVEEPKGKDKNLKGKKVKDRNVHSVVSMDSKNAPGGMEGSETVIEDIEMEVSAEKQKKKLGKENFQGDNLGLTPGQEELLKQIRKDKKKRRKSTSDVATKDIVISKKLESAESTVGGVAPDDHDDVKKKKRKSFGGMGLGEGQRVKVTDSERSNSAESSTGSEPGFVQIKKRLSGADTLIGPASMVASEGEGSAKKKVKGQEAVTPSGSLKKKQKDSASIRTPASVSKKKMETPMSLRSEEVTPKHGSLKKKKRKSQGSPPFEFDFLTPTNGGNTAERKKLLGTPVVLSGNKKGKSPAGMNVTDGNQEKIEKNLFVQFEKVKTPPAAFVKKAMTKVTPKGKERKTPPKSPGKGSATSSNKKKRVSFIMTRNMAQEYKDSLRMSPVLPFTPDKKPDQGILKSPLVTPKLVLRAKQIQELAKKRSPKMSPLARTPKSVQKMLEKKSKKRKSV